MALQHILIAVDEAPPVQLLVDQVGPLARASGAELSCVHFVADPGDGGRARAEAEKGLAELGEAMRQRGIPTRTRVLTGGVEEELERLSGYRDVSLFAVVHHGERSAQLYSTADRIVHRVPLPVLVLHQPAAEVPPPGLELRRIAVASDFRPHSEAGVRYALELADQLGARLELLHVHRVEGMRVEIEPRVVWPPLRPSQQLGYRAALEGVADFLGHHPGRNHTGRVVSAEDPAVALVAAALEGHNDLIVISTRGRSRFVELFTGSVTRDLIHLAPVPVVAIRADL